MLTLVIVVSKNRRNVTFMSDDIMSKYDIIVSDDACGDYVYHDDESFNDVINDINVINERSAAILGTPSGISKAMRCNKLTGIHFMLEHDDNEDSTELPQQLLDYTSDCRTYDHYVNLIESETKYLELLSRLIEAPLRDNRTGISTRGLFTEVLKFPLYDFGGRVLPLITTKNVPFKSVYEELLMFILGETNTKRLDDKNIPIWKGNTSREFLDSRGLNDYPVGTLGPVYGYQWRHFGGDWKNPSSAGIDQLKQVIDILRIDPTNRRMVVSTWNPCDLDSMALMPCHYSFQFHCDYDYDRKIATRLNCQVNMRSADVALGVPFNIASYAMLTHIISAITKIPPGTLSIVMTDCHLYTNHIDGVKKQLSRDCRRFPHIELSNIDNIDNIESLTYEITGYNPHPYIKLPMAI